MGLYNDLLECFWDQQRPYIYKHDHNTNIPLSFPFIPKLIMSKSKEMKSPVLFKLVTLDLLSTLCLYCISHV